MMKENAKPAFELLLWDVDGTLLDFKAGAENALKKAFEAQNLPFDSTIPEMYFVINQKLWMAFERGEIARETLLVKRFQLLFETLQIKEDAAHFETIYQALWGKQYILIDGAVDVLEALKGKYRNFIVTNGVLKTQLQRLKESGLAQYFEDVFISEFVGSQKPCKAFFDYCFSHISNANRQKALIIGDSLTSDILGGIQSGIATCWYNPGKEDAGKEILPDYEITKLTELLTLL